MIPTMQSPKLPGLGLVLGKFLPPHRGHQFLIDFAQNAAEEVVVVIGSLDREPIPGDLRYHWLKTMYSASPAVQVLHLDRELPQYPHEHPDFWDIWRHELTSLVQRKIDYVFASEEYGWRLAQVLEAEFVPVNIDRSIFPVSGTAVREDPLKNWAYIPAPVRPYFLKRVAVVGPESSGKTTLTEQLAARYQTRAVPEYARTLLEAKGGVCEIGDFNNIVAGQLATLRALESEATRIIFSDTELYTTALWTELFTGKRASSIQALAKKQDFDLYLLLRDDIPFESDPVRYFPDKRSYFFNELEKILKEDEKPYAIIEGDRDQRTAAAEAAILSNLGVSTYTNHFTRWRTYEWSSTQERSAVG